MDRVYAVKCLVKNEFEPSYENYSSYEEVTYLLPANVLVWEDEQVDKNKLADYLRGLVEDGYVNADGIWKQSRLFYIAGVQEMDDRVEFDGPAVEVYRWFYNFDRPVTEEGFLNLYYFDDLGREGMSRREQVILTNMCMITDGQRVLVQDRKSEKWPGVTFPGGHVEPNESIISSVIREVKEETGLTVSNLELCGIQNWTDPTDHYRYLVFCYKTSHFSGSIQSSDEGEVFWIDRENLKNVPLADGFESMLEIFEQPQLTENFYWFEDGEWKVENR